MRGFSRVAPAAWLSLRHGSLGAVGNSNLRCSLSSPCAGDKSLDKDPAKRVASISSPRGQTIRSWDRHRKHSSPNWARQGQCLETAARAFGLQPDDDGSGTSGHHSPERPRLTERGKAFSAWALKSLHDVARSRWPARRSGRRS
jgi:hypothetical protein